MNTPNVPQQQRYLWTSLICALLPIVVIAVLPEPWHSSLLPIAALLGSYGVFFASGLILYALEAAWRVLRRSRPTVLQCPVCHTIEQPYQAFYVRRIGPSLLRINCPVCHEHWIARQ